jgi:hypothetical protein
MGIPKIEGAIRGNKTLPQSPGFFLTWGRVGRCGYCAVVQAGAEAGGEGRVDRLHTGIHMNTHTPSTLRHHHPAILLTVCDCCCDVVSRLRLAQELAEKEESHLTLEEQYSSLQEEVEVKTKKLKKLWNKCVNPPPQDCKLTFRPGSQKL